MTAVLDGLRRAVANWSTDRKHNGPADYWYGRSACDHWIDDVLHAEVLDASLGGLPFATWWNMDVIAEARRQAAEWLREAASQCGGAAAAHLRAGAPVFLREHQLLWQAWGVEDAFSADLEKWSRPEHRTHVAEVLAEARDLEAAAAGELGCALEAAE